MQILHQLHFLLEDHKALLYDFLEQFLFLLDTETFLLHEVKEIKIIKVDKGFNLKVKIIGDTQIDKYEPETHIKAVTYQEMEINQDEKGFMLQVILDL